MEQKNKRNAFPFAASRRAGIRLLNVTEGETYSYATANNHVASGHIRQKKKKRLARRKVQNGALADL